MLDASFEEDYKAVMKARQQSRDSGRVVVSEDEVTLPRIMTRALVTKLTLARRLSSLTSLTKALETLPT